MIEHGRFPADPRVPGHEELARRVARFAPRSALLLNLSVWTSPEALFNYVYKSQHTAFLVKRRQWFEKPAQAHMVLWWVPAGQRPTLAEALERLELLRRQGPSAQAFTFKQRFPPPGSNGEAEDMRPEPYCSGWQ